MESEFIQLHSSTTISAFCFTFLPISIVDFTPNYASTVPFANNILEQLPVTMSLIPHLSKELSPWPRIRLGEVPSKSTAVDRRMTLPRLHRGSSQQSGSTPSSIKTRGRASSDAGPVSANVQSCGRSTNFGSTQAYEDVFCSGPRHRLDRKVSDDKVHELLKLRKRKLKEAKRRGDEVEFLRLKNLNLFDDIERPNDKPREGEFSGETINLPDHHGFTSQIEVLDVGFTPRSKAVNQGHTATLCWHLKLEDNQGLKVPREFLQCGIHPTPSPGASSNSSLTLQPASPSSLSAGSRHSLRHTKDSSISSSTLRDSSEPSSPAKWSSKAVALEPSSPTKDSSSIIPNSDEEDPFLYIAKYIQRHAKRVRHLEATKRSVPQASSADTKRSSHIQCTCMNHHDRTYLSGPPSKHCRFCKLPKSPSEITAAASRIEKMMKTPVLAAQADTDDPAEKPSEAADEFRKFEALQEDVKLVEMYNAETEKRCRNGVWWEGWLIVEDLKKQGIVGSIPFVYKRDKDNAVAFLDLKT